MWIKEVVALWVVVMPPPQQYLGAYDGTLTVRRGNAATIMARCSVRGKIGYACAYVEHLKTHKCTIWLPDVGTIFPDGTSIDEETHRKMRIHEESHCAGWPITHPTH